LALVTNRKRFRFQICYEDASTVPYACRCNNGFAPAPHAPDFCCVKAESVCGHGTPKCNGNGSCVDDFNVVRKYACMCNDGFEGRDCEKGKNSFLKLLLCVKKLHSNLMTASSWVVHNFYFICLATIRFDFNYCVF